MSDPTFLSLHIEAFRGFNEPVTFDLSGSVVLLRGPNGTGKTSVFDALQWLLLGEIERLRKLRERRDAEHLVNQYRVPGPAVVEAQIALNGGIGRVRRSGNYSGSQLSFQMGDEHLEGDDAVQALTSALLPQGSGDIGAVLLTSGMLQQDVMRSLLEAKPGERFAVISRLLRLEELERFQKAAERSAERASARTGRLRADVQAARRKREAVDQELMAVRESLREERSIETAVAEFDEAVKTMRGAIELSGRPETVQAASVLAREALTVRHRISELALELDQLDSQRTGREAGSEDRERMQARALGARQELDELATQKRQVETRVVDVERATIEFARLASLAIPFLGETCPICTQRIDPSEVESHLTERAEGTTRLLELREESDRLAAATREVSERLVLAERQLRELREIEAEQSRREDRRKALFEDLRRACEGRLLKVEADLAVRGSFELVERELLDLERVADQLAAALSSSAAAARLGELSGVLDGARELEQEITERLERTARAESDATTLVKATKAARVEVAEQRYARVRPLVQNLFARLDAHRAFTDLDLEPTVYGRAGTTVMATTRDPARGVSASPALVYSSAQANVAALAYFVALSWGARDHSLPFLMLDDPLQAMDDVNVLAFADLCRFMRARRQLFVSTHERRFADLLERKLAPRYEADRTVVLDFTGWDRGGPEVRQRVLPDAPVGVADVFLRQRTDESRAAS